MNNEPVFKKREAFKVIGIERYTANGIPSIQEAWNEFSKRIKDIPNAVLPGVYGVEDYSRDFVGITLLAYFELWLVPVPAPVLCVTCFLDCRKKM